MWGCEIDVGFGIGIDWHGDVELMRGSGIDEGCEYQILQMRRGYSGWDGTGWNKTGCWEGKDKEWRIGEGRAGRDSEVWECGPIAAEESRRYDDRFREITRALR